MASTSGRRVVQILTNKSGGAVAAGDVVVIDTTTDESFTTTTTGSATVPIGVAQEAIANNASGRVCTAGYVALVNVNASVTRGHYAFTHTVAKQASGNASRGTGAFGVFLKSSATPSAWLFGIADGSSAGLGTWTNYSPTLTAVTTNPTLGSSVVAGRYKQLDSKTYIVVIRFTVTTGGAWNAGSGEWKFSLPAGLTAGGDVDNVGTCHVLDSGTARFAGVAIVSAGATVIWPMILADSTGDRVLKHNNPVTWATGDTVQIQVTVEVA